VVLIVDRYCNCICDTFKHGPSKHLGHFKNCNLLNLRACQTGKLREQKQGLDITVWFVIDFSDQRIVKYLFNQDFYTGKALGIRVCLRKLGTK